MIHSHILFTHIPARRIFVVILIFVICGIFGTLSTTTYAETEIETLQKQINERGNRLKEIEAEIAGYQTDLKKVGGEKTSLQKAVNQLEIERKKVQADIQYTQNKIGATDLELNKLSLEINTTEEGIDLNKKAITETLLALRELDDDSLIEMLLQYENLSDFWEKIDELDQIRRVISTTVDTLDSQQKLLSEKHEINSQKRANLVNLNAEYSDQNSVLIDNKAEKSKLLSATKNEESNYQKLLKQKEAAKELILKEMRDFESKLKFILDPTTIPPQGTAVFNWPVQGYVITQLFGGTEFAKQNSSVYGGRPYHPGIDLGVPRGTKIYAPLGGTVRAIGNTDLVPGCYSWGMWTLIDHANGLSTLYAHQSVQSVVPGQQVQTGDIIGYSGNSGYSTGPHLHFTVYAKAGVSVRKFNEIKSVTSCGAATTPVAATDAYLDPMLYLPH